MLWLIPVILAGWALSIAAICAVLRSMLRAHARERDLVINQLLHATGNTWSPPPAQQDFADMHEEENLVNPDLEWSM